jgi:hypothetical protein
MTPYTMWMLLFGEFFVNPFYVLRKKEEAKRSED